MAAIDTELLTFAGELADTSRRIVTDRFRQALTVEYKQDASPVTLADQEAERALRELIDQRYPEHGVQGEEFDDKLGDGEYVWVIDPIDGTKSFITGKPTFGTLIALLRDEAPVLGVIDAPALRERWVGASGHATTLNGQVCQASRVTGLASATLYSTTPDMFDEEEMARLNDLSRQLRYRCWGADCYAYGLVASGHTELVVESDMKPYDYLAVVAVIEGAGGVVTDWQGRSLGRRSGPQIIAAANRELHRAALGWLDVEA